MHQAALSRRCADRTAFRRTSSSSGKHVLKAVLAAAMLVMIPIQSGCSIADPGSALSPDYSPLIVERVVTSSNHGTMDTDNVEISSIVQALIIAESSDPDEAFMRASEYVRMTQHLPPRIAVAEGNRSQLDAVRALPDVFGVFEKDIPGAVLQKLNPTERLFVEAWVLAREPKSRPGEGLPWDADGFESP